MNRSDPNVKENIPFRLCSLDVFRGIAIAGMIIVNNPGNWQHIYPALRHSKWNGCTPADMVFPFFLFIVGASMSFSFTDYVTKGTYPGLNTYIKIIRRTLILFLLGLLINFSTILLKSFSGNYLFSLEELRIMGVLQRISLVYLTAALTIIHLKPAKQWALFFLILFGYWLMLNFLPLPGHTPGNLSQGQSLVPYIDRLILTTPHMLNQGAFEPEGLLSSLPAYTSVLAGYFTGIWLKQKPAKTKTSLILITFGLIITITGIIFNKVFAVNKTLWTSSFVILTSGYAMILFAMCYELVEVRKHQKYTNFFKIMGRNSILAYLAAALTTRILLNTAIEYNDKTISVYSWIYKNVFISFLDPTNASLVFSITYLILIWLLIYIINKKNLFIKILDKNNLTYIYRSHIFRSQPKNH